MVNPGNQKNNITRTQPVGIQASTPWFINFLTSRYVQIAETIGMARIAKIINNIPTMKKAGDLADKSGIINADEKAKTTINPTITICNIRNPRKNNTFFIILMIKNFSFLLSKSPIRFCPENSTQTGRRAKRGEASPSCLQFPYWCAVEGSNPRHLQCK